jgi:signal transduction histidine kinase
MYIDENSNVIEDITEASADPFTNLVPMGHLESVQNVLEGKSGYTVEVVDNIEMLTVYEPVVVHEHRWGVLIMQPTADAYSAIDYLRNQSYAMLVIIVSIMGASGYFLVSFRAHSALAKELAKANSVLIEKDKLKDEFLRIASHELKTPIQPILGYSSLATRGKIDQNVAWKVVHTEAQRLMRLANNIVDISMIQAGILGYQMEKVAVAQVIELALDSIREAAKAKDLTLDLKLDEECQRVAIDADPSRLRRVFDELLENAVKFTEKGGIRVECRVEPATDEILIIIRDTGTAIPAAILPRLFDMFVSKSGSDPTTQGAGLGLFLCQGVVKAHKGTIVAQNNSEGLGACFEVRLPIHSVQERESRTKTAIT